MVIVEVLAVVLGVDWHATGARETTVGVHSTAGGGVGAVYAGGRTGVRHRHRMYAVVTPTAMSGPCRPN